jgi:HSP20 family protein
MNPDDEMFHDVLGALRGEMSRVMRQFGLPPNRPAFAHPTVWRPATDIFETRSDIIIRMEIAGTRKEDITVVFDDDILTVRGLRREDPRFQKTGVSRMEIDYGPFEQRIALPRQIDAGGIEAAYKEGFLTIRVPKSAEMRTQAVCVRIRE